MPLRAPPPDGPAVPPFHGPIIRPIRPIRLIGPIRADRPIAHQPRHRSHRSHGFHRSHPTHSTPRPRAAYLSTLHHERGAPAARTDSRLAPIAPSDLNRSRPSAESDHWRPTLLQAAWIQEGQSRDIQSWRSHGGVHHEATTRPGGGIAPACRRVGNGPR